MGIFEKFKLGFKKSADSISSGLRDIIVKKEIDDETLNKIEEFLISSDVGIDASSEIKSIISQKKIDPKKDAVEEINLILKEYILELMIPLERKDFFENMPKGIFRRIIARGTNDEMIKLEHKLLKNRYDRCWDRYYNESLGDPRYIDMSGENNPMFGKTHTQDARQKVSESQTGSGNSMYGTMWITDGTNNKRIRKGKPIQIGFKPGRKQHPNVGANNKRTALGKHWYTDGKTERLAFSETPLPSGFKRGRIVHPKMRRG